MMPVVIVIHDATVTLSAMNSVEVHSFYSLQVCSQKVVAFILFMLFSSTPMHFTNADS